MNLNFTQMISFRCDDPERLVELAAGWDHMNADADIMGYMGSHILSDREEPGRYLLIAEFGVIDPDVPAADEAARNDARPETEGWFAKLLDVIDGEPEFHNYDEIYRTG
jgi:hypothetical protein